MSRPGRTRDRAHRAAEVVLGLLLAAAAAAQAEPEYWQRYDELRRELCAAGADRLAAGLWGGKTDAGLAWLHGYLTSVDDAAVYQRWFAGDADATLGLLHAAMWARPATDRARVLADDLRLLGALKDWGLFADASRLLADGMLPWVGDRPERFEFLLHAAEVHRRLYEWEQADAALAAAAAAAPHTGAAGEPVRLAVQRAALLLARGLPDLAVPEIERAEREAGTPLLAAQALFVRLRLEHALQRPERALAAMRQFEQRPLPAALLADKAWKARVTQLRIRAALAVLADPEQVPADAGEAVAWLHAAIAAAETPADERLLARTVLVTYRLDRGQCKDVDAQLAAAAAELPAAAPRELDERRLAVATLRLRAARSRSAEPAVVARCAQELERLWRALVDRWLEQPCSRVGEGPLFFGDLRRALVELLRSHSCLEPGAPGALAVLDEVVRAQAVGSLAKALGAAAPDLPAIRAALCPPGHGLLVYVPGHDVSPLLAIDRDAVTLELLPAGALGIDRRRQRLLGALQAARGGDDPAEFAAAAQELAAILLPTALRPRLRGWQAVTIVGLESLGYLPFELLPLAGKERLGLTHAVTYLPSLPVGVWLAQHRTPPPGGHRPQVRILACPDALAPPGAIDRPEPLAFGAREAALLQAAIAPASAELLRGAAATAAALGAEAPPVDFVQILAHGVRDESRADPQGILLGDGTVLWPADLGAATANSPAGAPYWLVTACRAGRGRLRRGDDGRHLLSGAALLAGARGVVAPVLDVGYRASLEFAADLHRGLWQEGLPLAEALRRARVAAVARQGAGSWDAFLFHLVGLGDLALAPPAEPKARRWLPPGIGALAVLAAGFLAWRRPRRAPPSGPP